MVGCLPPCFSAPHPVMVQVGHMLSEGWGRQAAFTPGPNFRDSERIRRVISFCIVSGLYEGFFMIFDTDTTRSLAPFLSRSWSPTRTTTLAGSVGKQWAAVMTTRLDIIVPPQKGNLCRADLKSPTCHGHRPSFASRPPTILD